MDEKEQAKRTNLMKLEAMGLFAGIRAQASSDRWWYFGEMRRMGRAVRMEQSLSAYRASLYWDYLFCGVECQVFLEREAHMGKLGENMWSISFSGIEGKVNALAIHDRLKSLQAEGFYIPNGNENLERQMNFSLGLYGACLMHVDVRFPSHLPPLPCALRVMDVVDEANRMNADGHLAEIIEEMEKKKASIATESDEEDPDIMMGDWQTWK